MGKSPIHSRRTSHNIMILNEISFMPSSSYATDTQGNADRKEGAAEWTPPGSATGRSINSLPRSTKQLRVDPDLKNWHEGSARPSEWLPGERDERPE